MTLINSLSPNLHLKLKSYGLNPLDWRVRRHGQNRCLLIHREDKQFTLIGRTRRVGEKMEWHSLRLLTL